MKTRIVRAMLLSLLAASPALRAAEPEPGATDDARRALLERGSYLVHRVAMCVQCHSPRDERGGLLDNKLLKGAAMPLESPFRYQVWAFLAPPLAGLPVGYTEGDMVKLLMQGKRPNGTALRHPMPPYRFDEQDARAVAAYLHAVGRGGEAKDIAAPARREPARAVGVLRPAEGSQAQGAVVFTFEDGAMHIRATVAGLTPGLHGFHILAADACDGEGGGHLDPGGHPHGAPDAERRHLGDLGNLVADEYGRAHYERIDPRMTFSGEHSILGRSIVVHEGWDDLRTQPDGASGAPVACGVIQRAP